MDWASWADEIGTSLVTEFEKGPSQVTSKRICAAAVVVALLGFAAPSRVCANPVEWFQFGPLDAVDVVSISYGSFHNLEVYAGQYGGILAATQAGLSSPSAQTIYTFCVDLNDEVNLSQQYEVALTSTNTGLANGPRIAYLYETFGEGLIAGSNVNGSGLGAADYAAALQLAIWDELANNGSAPTVTSPLQYSGLNAGVATQIQTFLTEAATHTATANWLNPDITQPPNISRGQGFIAPPGQDFHFEFQTPEPSTLTLAATGLCVLFAVRRRRQLRAA
jgi:hypothetical protein